MIAFAIFVASLLGLFGLAVAIDRVRGVDSEAVAALRELNDSLTPDDAPMWAEVCGPVLAVGLTVRSSCHVWMALLAGVDPRVASQDVAMGSSVRALRDGPWVVDLSGRLLAASVGVTLWLLVDPLRVGMTAPVWLVPIIRGFAVGNIGVLLADPLLFAGYRLRNNSETESMHDATTTAETTHSEVSD